jgi:hypothetical protein
MLAALLVNPTAGAGWQALVHSPTNALLCWHVLQLLVAVLDLQRILINAPSFSEKSDHRAAPAFDCNPTRSSGTVKMHPSESQSRPFDRPG